MALVELENFYDVHVITQNVDDLHERAGSQNILHLHGEIMKSQSTVYPYEVYDILGDELNMGDLCPAGFQLRPNVVWFGEAVPNMAEATQITGEADLLIVVGTSLQVYPAATLIHAVNPHCKVYLVDPNAAKINVSNAVMLISENACSGLPKLLKMLTE